MPEENVLKTSQVMLQKGERKTMLQRPPQARKEVGPGISLHIVLVHSLTLDTSESIELPLQNKRSYQSSEEKKIPNSEIKECRRKRPPEGSTLVCRRRDLVSQSRYSNLRLQSRTPGDVNFKFCALLWDWIASKTTQYQEWLCTMSQCTQYIKDLQDMTL